MRTPLVLLALAGALLSTPLSQAQIPSSQYNVVLSLTPPEQALTENLRTLVLEGKVDVMGDPLMALNTHGVPVTYAVTRTPAWLAASVSPQSDVIPLAHQGHLVQGSKTFTLSLVLSQPPSGSVADVVEVTATTSPTAPGSMMRSASQSVLVQYFVPEPEQCEEHLVATAELMGPQPAEDEEPVLVQSSGATPVGTWYAVGGFALVGAGVGLALRRRFSR